MRRSPAASAPGTGESPAAGLPPAHLPSGEAPLLRRPSTDPRAGPARRYQSTHLAALFLDVLQAEFRRAAPNGALCAALMGLLNGTLRDFGAAILVAPAEAVGAPPGRFFHSPAGSDDDGRAGPSR